MTKLRGRKFYKALTIVRNGRLSKDHLSDPKIGLPLESKKAQAEPVEVVLNPMEVLDINSVREGMQRGVRSLPISEKLYPSRDGGATPDGNGVGRHESDPIEIEKQRSSEDGG